MTEQLEFLRRVARDLEAAGAVPGEDFFVHFVNEGSVSSDYYGLRPAGDAFEVYYSERGQRRVLEQTADPERAWDVFSQRVLAVAAERGPQQS